MSSPRLILVFTTLAQQVPHFIKNIASRYFLLIVMALSMVSCGTVSGFREMKLDTETGMMVDTMCLNQGARSNFPGLSIAVASKGKRIWSKGFGYADIKTKTPVDPEGHLFRIGSISKTVTASALARMNQKEEIFLDTPISAWYDACPEDKKQITLRQLGGHLAGIRHYLGLEFFSNIGYDNVTTPMEVFIHDSLLCEPGTKFNYSTYGWTVISAVMEYAAHTPFLEIIKKQVSDPLRLNDLKADHKDSTQYNRVVFYDYQNGGHILGPGVDNSNKWAGGGFLCSAEDLARYGYAHTRAGYLKEETLKAFTESQLTTGGDRTNYGIGFWSGRDKAGRFWYGHSGGSVGGTSMLLIYPEEDLVVVTLVNLSGARMEELAFRIADVFLQK